MSVELELPFFTLLQFRTRSLRELEAIRSSRHPTSEQVRFVPFVARARAFVEDPGSTRARPLQRPQARASDSNQFRTVGLEAFPA